MAYTVIPSSWRAVGAALRKQLFDRISDNLEALDLLARFQFIDNLSGTFTATAGSVHLVVTTAVTSTITLPTAAAGNNGYRIIVKDKSGLANTRNITILGESSGALIINTSYGVRGFVSNGAAWYAI